MNSDWFGDILKDNEKSGERLKGMGKPLSRETLEGNVLDRTVKNAGYLPEWVSLQQEVRSRLITLIPNLQNVDRQNEIDQEIDAINILVKKYNKICPAPMQKMLITQELAETQLKRWE
ncbi:DnaJ family domain-containing protein [Alkalihalobacterium sp. APHAB7]|uniref:DnaJ family domain-containing protein n=1 Tax=Alkalihalobacterium sp. APHAB7 TaxID=3402081 RepID=UPI003AAEAF41